MRSARRVTRLAPALVAALSLGCAAPPPPTTLVVSAPAPPDPVLLFEGTYPKQDTVAFRAGLRVAVGNADGGGSLRVTRGTVVHEQRYPQGGKPVRVVQVYTFTRWQVTRVGDVGFDIPLTFQSIEGQGPRYRPDSGSPRLFVRRHPRGWEMSLMTIDGDHVLSLTAFGAEPPTRIGSRALAFALRVPAFAREMAALDPPRHLSAPAPDAQVLPSGLASKVLRGGSRHAHPGPRDIVTIHATGWTKDGTMYDSTMFRGEPMQYRLDRLMKGLREGIGTMVQGEKRRFWIPAALAYGSSPPSGLPAGDLVVDVELLGIAKTVHPPPVPEDVKGPPPTATRTPSGLAYRVLEKGLGKRSPKPSDTVTISYTQWTTDGRMGRSTVVEGAPLRFRVTHAIPGLTEAVQLMREGDRMRFWIPSNLAYGDEPTDKGTPVGMLVEDITLHRIE
jgi:FKBP-type peptidyl-prolyl cis-trans isomerase